MDFDRFRLVCLDICSLHQQHCPVHCRIRALLAHLQLDCERSPAIQTAQLRGAGSRWFGCDTQRVKPTQSLHYAFDALNRLTNMVDAVGTSRFSYATNGLLAAEDGPWDADTVGFSYGTAPLRSRLTLLQPNASDWVQNVNQLTTATRSGTLTVAGTSSETATSVTVNGQSATRYTDKTFARAGFSLASGNNTFTAVAQDALGRSDTNAVTVNLPATVTFQYDPKGNLTNDGRRIFTYDRQSGQIYIIDILRLRCSTFIALRLDPAGIREDSEMQRATHQVNARHPERWLGKA